MNGRRKLISILKMEPETVVKERNYLISEDLRQLSEKHKEKDPDYASEIMELREFYLEESKK